ncbi:hypothetical protein [Marivita sp. GX14005]|uniref:hypothetical protein n=1 Tax=Marivita sp. GX14005 TaxID=2942276 RepID=UPI002019C2C4|nr:hypothetical protein [Marivita sp. GX14005]MCL3882674.1 hypothetical protein [Marivita sp. GX14005]
MAKQANFDLGYSITDDGDKRHISFKGDGLPWSAYVILPISMVIILAVSLSILPVSYWFLPILLFAGIGFVIYKMYQIQTFTLTQGSIIKDGAAYDLPRVSEVLIDNPMDKDVSYTAQPGFIVGGSGVSGASMAVMGTLANATTSAMLGASAAISSSSAKRRYRVRIRYGSKVITLARNLKYDRAVAIFQLLTQP